MESEGKAAGGRAVQRRLILWLSVLWEGVDYGTRMETNVFNLNVFFTCVSLFFHEFPVC